MNIDTISYSDITILCVDDEKNILDSLNRGLRSFSFNVLTAQSGAQALSILQAEKVDIVISDMKMPEMSGIEFLESVSKHFPSVYRILLTGYTEMQSLIQAVNKGNIHHYFEKPWEIEDVTDTLIKLAKKIRLEHQQSELQTLLKKQNIKLFSAKTGLEKKIEVRTQQIRHVLSKHEQNEMLMQKLLANIIKINPHMDQGFHNAVSYTASRIAKYCKVQLAEHKEIALAAKFCDIGLLGLDIKSLCEPFNTLKFHAQQAYLSQIHQVSLLLASADGLRNLETILVNQFEYVNGTGYPNNLLLEDIPRGSRILAIARDYWRYRMGKIMNSKLSHKNTLSEIKKYAGTRYDSALVNIMIENPQTTTNTLPNCLLTTPDLESGMILSKSVFGNKHHLLLSEGHVLTHENIQSFVRYEKVQNIQLKISVDPIQVCD